jgi:hypothetical protein
MAIDVSYNRINRKRSKKECRWMEAATEPTEEHKNIVLGYKLYTCTVQQQHHCVEFIIILIWKI